MVKFTKHLRWIVDWKQAPTGYVEPEKGGNEVWGYGMKRCALRHNTNDKAQ